LIACLTLGGKDLLEEIPEACLALHRLIRQRRPLGSDAWELQSLAALADTLL
jgi:hypothetical protein